MVERQEVETILAEVHSMAEINRVAVGDIAHPVEGDTLAALCRAWLALDGGLPGAVDSILYADGGKRRATTIQHVDSEEFPIFRGSGRVRIVPVEGDQ